MPMNVIWEGFQAQNTRLTADGQDLEAWLIANADLRHNVDIGRISFTTATIRQVHEKKYYSSTVNDW